MKMLHIILCATVLMPSMLAAQSAKAEIPEPIIDMHLHAFDAQWGGGWKNVPYNFQKLRFPDSEDALIRETFDRMREFNIVKAFTSGPLRMIDVWHRSDPERIMPSPMIAKGQLNGEFLALLEKLHGEGKLAGLGEIINQYEGVMPDDTGLAPVFALAERLDLPVGIHFGMGPPGVAYAKGSGYRMSRSSALLLEPVLIRHPKLRIYVMHAGWPLLDDMVALLWAYPNVYVDVSCINWYTLPRAEFHSYLKRLVDAGFGKRIMYGSDQMIWPDSIKLSIEAIQSAEFLTHEQKRDIFYNNAARFLRLSDDEIAKHHRKAKG